MPTVPIIHVFFPQDIQHHTVPEEMLKNKQLNLKILLEKRLILNLKNGQAYPKIEEKLFIFFREGVKTLYIYLMSEHLE